QGVQKLLRADVSRRDRVPNCLADRPQRVIVQSCRPVADGAPNGSPKAAPLFRPLGVQGGAGVVADIAVEVDIARPKAQGVSLDPPPQRRAEIPMPKIIQPRR